jgi:hypothetical protein
VKTLLLAAAVLSLGFGVANAETRKDAMHDTMKQTETMRDGDRMAMKHAAAHRQTVHAVTSAWQNDTGLAGGGG